MPNDFNKPIIEEFRANGGQVGGRFEGARLLLLTTTGARSGIEHTAPLGYLPDEDDRILVIASAAGASKHPAWFHNLLAQPRVRVEDGVFSYEAEASVLDGDERDRIFARAAEADPGWAAYQAKTTRVLPVVALRQVAGGPPAAESWGAALKLIHDAFRREFSLIRKEIARSGTGLGVQLRVNCLTACRGLSFHHRAEDEGMFPALAEQHPELAPTMQRLNREHERMARLLAELQEAIATEDADPLRLLSEVERLTEELEAHLTYEEEQLIPILDTLP